MIRGVPTDDLYMLSDEDAYEIAKLLRQNDQKVWNQRTAAIGAARPSLTEISAIAIVRTPPTGIPAMWPANGTGTGIGSAAQDDYDNVIGTGTGTAIYGGERPGSASCESLYLLGTTASGRALNRPRLLRTGPSITVYNPSFEPIPGNVYLPVQRDGFGSWWPALGNVSGTIDPINFDEGDCQVTLSSQGSDVVVQAVGTGTTCDPYMSLSGCTIRLHRGDGVVLSSLDLTNCINDLVDAHIQDLCRSETVVKDAVCNSTNLDVTYVTIHYLTCPEGGDPVGT